jgi:hypothetical protein
VEVVFLSLWGVLKVVEIVYFVTHEIQWWKNCHR